MKAAWYEKMPDRGHLPPELERIAGLEFREVFCKLCRIIYQIIGNNVYVHCMLDGRRDMQDTLQQRVLREDAYGRSAPVPQRGISRLALSSA